jgi:RimJ/RimL family protein N-acetyltransferase
MCENNINFMQELESIVETYEYDRDSPLSADEVTKSCLWFIENAKFLPNAGAIRWIITFNGVNIGEAHINCNWEETREWEIGWHLLPTYWGKGFAGEAITAIIKYAFTHFKIHRLVAFCCTENVRSVALAKRVGMKIDGRMREVKFIKGKYYDEYVCSILESEVVII